MTFFLSLIISSVDIMTKCRTDLEQVGPDTLVSTLLGHLLGQPCDLIRSLGDVLGALDEGALVSASATHQARHFGHEQGHSFGSTNDVVALRGATGMQSISKCGIFKVKSAILCFQCVLTLLDHLRASSWSCLAATIMGSLTISPAFCSGNSSSFSSGGGGLGGGTSPSGRGGLGGAASSLSYKDKLK